MSEISQLPLLGKVFISGKLICCTGLHIGASKETLEIGGIDSAVVRDPLTRQPYIPGSSLKGKLRYLMERSEKVLFNRSTGQGKRHECPERGCPVCRLFGSTGAREGDNIPSPLRVRDLFLTEESRDLLEKMETPLQYTEWKFENALDRVTAAANPRNLERVPAGAEFQYEIVYDVLDFDQAREDLANLLRMMQLLEDDALGGHGSRGYGKVAFAANRMEVRTIDQYKGEAGEAVAVEADKLDGLAAKLEELFKALANGG
ncbi:MAG: type III-A CRISPR-associated RAMP protein Csm3 [Actinobacteria bacterium]|nr:type III-A CRISPR-associated RAMP protein Csm3 [Actinomycetota bacterium]